MLKKSPSLLGAILLCSASIFPSFGAELGTRFPRPSLRVAEPVVADASDEAVKNMKTFQVPPGFKVELVAAEPMLANPVAFCIDWQNRFFISETHRYRSSVLDIRHYMFMLEDDLALRSVEERIAMTRKHFGGAADDLAVESELVRLVEDTDGDHKADRSTVFADRFSTVLDGIASGVLARKDKVYFTNIPHLWELRDLDKDGRAELRKSLSYGYGVRFSYTGHDMHGLAIGPDGKLYFSFGDRGANVLAKEGHRLNFPDEGAVFRCDLDGSNLEVVHSGLRNPQELAFDDFGNLFTGDNDCDNGDSERWVYIVEGGESGWRVGYQHAPLGNAGQWMSESLWKPRFPGQAAYILPPIANLFDGPSGLTCNPGTGFPAQYAGHFFLTHFKGQASISGISSIQLKPKGASFVMTKQDKFIWNCLPTDVDFGYDGSLYFTDWHHDWPKSSRGRIYRVYDPQAVQLDPVREVRRLFSKGFAHRSLDELSGLLAHEDRRVRQESQFALADKALADKRDLNRAAVGRLLDAAKGAENGLARLHGIWGIGQVAARHPDQAKPLAGLLQDEDSEVRAQAAKVLGDAGYTPASKRLITALRDSSARVRFFAAQSLGKLGDSRAVAPLLEMLADNGDQDLYLRHAGVVALARLNDLESLQAAAAQEEVSLRRAALLAMRRLRSPAVAHFLNDPEALLALEAARAINDVPIPSAFPALAELANDSAHISSLRSVEGIDVNIPELLSIRVVNANVRLGGLESAERLARFAADDATDEKGRIEALHALATWANPHDRDRIMGVYRPLPARDRVVAAEALQARLPRLFQASSRPVSLAAIDAAGALGIVSAAPQLSSMAMDPALPPKVRAACLEALGRLDPGRLAVAVKRAILDTSVELRQRAITHLGILPPGDAIAALKTIMKGATDAEKKSALRVLGATPGAEAADLIREWLDRLMSGKAPVNLHLEILEAAEGRKEAAVKKKLAAYTGALPKDDELAHYRSTLYGGDKDAGLRIFQEKIEVSCQRCHRLNGRGGDVGPSVDGLGSKHPREYLLESIVTPSRKIAEGYANVSVELRNGDEFSGTIKRESNNELQLNLADGSVAKIAKADITLRQTSALSGMPPGMGEILSKRELRDLIEFLASLKEPAQD
jgi:quinoprotein glucose dehydrogenase